MTHLSYNFLNTLLAGGLIPDAWRFYRNLKNVRRVQEKKLTHYVHQNRSTEYGKKYHFNAIRTIRDYQDRVPVVAYEDIRDWIDTIASGVRAVLTAETPFLLEPTGGTTGGTKLIPYTRSLKREFQLAVYPWLFDLYRRYPGIRSGSSYWVITPAVTKPRHTKDSIPMGFESDTDYLGLLGKVLGKLLAVPPEVGLCRDYLEYKYTVAFFLLASPHLTLISVWNPTLLLLLIECIQMYCQDLIRDIADAEIRLPSQCAVPFYPRSLRPSKKRALELEHIFSSHPHSPYTRVWKNLQLISCWGDAAACYQAQKLQELFPGVHIQHKGLLATEGVISVPIEEAGGCVVAYTSHFFEFLPEWGGRPKLLWELEAGETYSVILTTGGGLYRYSLQDRVQVKSLYRNVPVIRFVGRPSGSDMVGEKLDGVHVHQTLESVLQKHEILSRFFLFAPHITEHAYQYTLYLETTEQLSDDKHKKVTSDIDSALKNNFHYRHARDLGQLLEPRLLRIRNNGSHAYYKRCLESGQRLGDIKPAILDSRTGWDNYFFYE
jgi:hypothetical protein